MSACRQNCDQGRTCNCCEFLTPEENKRFWRTIGWFAAADIALIAFLLWARP